MPINPLDISGGALPEKGIKKGAERRPRQGL
ncbi:hypothetical protein HCH_00870 [Hahella chejuensis KCTC 2396]|uniref:Uncharacterized protein n=1 Tax=Hahella chejuensis (strain KCTC 2396) TaxID=349521 RepID=Q2SNL3_HAHCH|nr:hypothetical protein HCH_00870 [Hahella chejuensis KCTC 2396]